MSRDSIGALLKSERETRELSIEEVSNTTRIPRRTLQSLEENRFEDLPSGVFVRGFIKAYASAVDIDAQEVLAQFDEERPRDVLLPPPAGIQRTRGYGLLLGLTTAILFAIIVATFVLVRRAPAQNEPIELSSAASCQAERDKAVRSSFDPSTIGIPIVSSQS